MANEAKIKAILVEINQVLSNSTPVNDGFLGGMLGSIFYYFQYSVVLEDEEIDSLARNLLNEYIEKFSNNSIKLDPFSYCNGLAGFAYAMSHLNQAKMINIDMEEEFPVIEEMLFKSAMALIECDHNDFLHGAFGIIHYFASRSRTDTICLYLDQLICKLEEKLITIDELSCIANLSLPSNKVKEKINLSLSHGLNGFVLILLNLLENYQSKEPLLRLIRHCINILYKSHFSNITDDFHLSKFPVSMHLATGDKKYSNRLGWCYGDLGQLLLFHRLEKVGLLPEDYAPILDGLATATVQRKMFAHNLVEDASFCHGAAGVAQFYATLYRLSGDKIYADAYEYWISETLTMVSQDLKNNNFKENEHSILDGFTGIGLTLLAYLSPAKLSWGEVVLLP